MCKWHFFPLTIGLERLKQRRKREINRERITRNNSKSWCLRNGIVRNRSVYSNREEGTRIKQINDCVSLVYSIDRWEKEREEEDKKKAPAFLALVDSDRLKHIMETLLDTRQYICTARGKSNSRLSTKHEL